MNFVSGGLNGPLLIASAACIFVGHCQTQACLSIDLFVSAESDHVDQVFGHNPCSVLVFGRPFHRLCRDGDASALATRPLQ